MNKETIEEIQAPYYFTDTEKLAIGKQMAETYQNLASVEDAKKQMTSQYKAQEEQMRATANLLQIKIIQGYESRPTRCYVTYDVPNGKKYYRHTETHQLLETRTMLKADYEQQLPLVVDKPTIMEAFAKIPTADPNADDADILATAEPSSVMFETTIIRANAATIQMALKDAKGRRKNILQKHLDAIPIVEAAAAAVEKEVPSDY